MNDAARQPAWTGGQYSLWRALLGAYLCVHFAALLRHADGSAAALACIVLGLLAALALAAGWRDRGAAVVVGVALALLFGMHPPLADPSLPWVGLLLVLHVGAPRAPYGALAARGRIDPGGGWFLPSSLWRAAWILLAAGYAFSGFTKLYDAAWRDGSAVQRLLAGPAARPGAPTRALLELPEPLLRALTWGVLASALAFAVLALSRRLRPLAWTALVAVHLASIALLEAADVSLCMLLVHLVAFDPRWVRPRRAARPERVYYDGECGLCHRTVRFCLAEDQDGAAFRFAPLQGQTFARELSAAARAALPDSVAVQAADGRLLDRSDAIAHLLRALGGLWGALGLALAAIPKPLRDLGYDAVARVRKRLFARPQGLCPLLPPGLAARFDP